MKASRKFNKEDLKSIYDEYFDALRGFLYYKCGDIEVAEDLVQEVFIKVWEKREGIEMTTIKSLLYTMCNNLLMNYFNHQKVVQRHQSEAPPADRHTSTPQFEMEEKEFEQQLNSSISDLPDGCREVFLMNRIDKLKYAEIAERLELSVKAVEKRMSKAISILKEKLGQKV